MNITELHQEEFLNFLESEISEKDRLFSTELPSYVQKINDLLHIQSPDSLEELLTLGNSDELRSNFYADRDMAYFILAAFIAKKELAQNIPPCIFKSCKSLTEITNLLTTLKHLLWHYEFNIGDSNKSDLLHFISEHNLAPFCVQILVENFAFHKLDVIKRLMFLFYENGYSEHALLLMNVLETYVKGADNANNE